MYYKYQAHSEKNNFGTHNSTNAKAIYHNIIEDFDSPELSHIYCICHDHLCNRHLGTYIISRRNILRKARSTNWQCSLWTQPNEKPEFFQTKLPIIYIIFHSSSRIHLLYHQSHSADHHRIVYISTWSNVNDTSYNKNSDCIFLSR